MLTQIVTYVTQLIISIIQRSGYLGIFGLMTAESALIPIPSEVTMTFAGYLVSIGKFNLYIVILIGTLANLFGSLLAYGIGYWGQESVVRILIKKYGKYLLISEAEFNRSEKWFIKYGEKITFFSRVLPVVRTFISLPAGIAHMNIWRFAILTFLGSLIWSSVLTYTGFILGKNWETIHVYYQRFDYLIAFGLLALFVYYVAHKLTKLKKSSHPHPVK